MTILADIGAIVNDAVNKSLGGINAGNSAAVTQDITTATTDLKALMADNPNLFGGLTGVHAGTIVRQLELEQTYIKQAAINPDAGRASNDNLLDIEGSTLSSGEIWTGSDDGMIHLTRDGGKHWSDVTPAGVPEFGRVETVAPSTINDGTAYVNLDRHRSDDFKPYLFVTHDFGRRWTSIVNNLPQNQYVRSVRGDIHNPRIVYAGTEAGMWVSFDDGGSWKDFRNNLPTVSVRDIRIQPKWNDLMIATHGRTLYIMDDIRPLQSLSGARTAGAH